MLFTVTAAPSEVAGKEGEIGHGNNPKPISTTRQLLITI
jgi:hypothetical protein